MCSIFGVLEVRQDLNAVRKMALRQSRLLRHRGPDWSGIHVAGSAVLAHERLSIVDVNTGAQPLLLNMILCYPRCQAWRERPFRVPGARQAPLPGRLDAISRGRDRGTAESSAPSTASPIPVPG